MNRSDSKPAAAVTAGRVARGHFFTRK